MSNMPKKYRCPATVGMSQDGTPRVIFCGQWSCPRCARKLAHKWAYRVMLHVDIEQYITNETGRQIFYFITFTLPGKVKTPERGFQLLPKLWNRLRQIMRRTTGKSWQYVAFVEGQPLRKHMPHYHIISNRPLPSKRGKKGQITEKGLHDFAVSIGFGFEVEQDVVSSRKAAWYVSKYASKQSPVTPKGFRRVRASQNWRKLPEKQREPLMIQSREESYGDFVARCSRATGLAESEIVLRLREARERAIAAELDYTNGSEAKNQS